jgi:sterol desaturase/sphingolipid hydroxylase (fatty acid hydroxylase superfamily)
MAGCAVLEQAWNLLITHVSEENLITWGTLVAHEVFYFGSYIPFLLADFIPALRKYKVQQEKPNTWHSYLRCLKYLVIVHFVVQWGMMLLFKPVVLYLGLVVSNPLPSWSSVAGTVLISFVLEDAYFYVVHRLLHYGPFYKYIHKKHHDFAAPIGIAAEYAHPVESLVLGIGTLVGPMLLTRHLFSLWVWLLVRLYQTVEAHSGYDFPWSPTKLIPFWGGSIFHDFHHETFSGNYASTFTYMDYIFGTSKQYYVRKDRREKERLEIEQKVNKVLAQGTVKKQA